MPAAGSSTKPNLRISNPIPANGFYKKTIKPRLPGFYFFNLFILNLTGQSI